MKKIFLILVLTSIYSYSQSRNVPFKNGVFNNNMEFFAMAKISNKNNSEHSTKNKGYYYFKNKWNKCRVITKDNKDYTFEVCNYNIFDKRFEFIIDNTTYFLKKNEVDYVFINNNKFKPFNNQTTLNRNYYKEIHKFNKDFKLIEIYNLKKRNVASNSTLGLYHNKIKVKSKKYILKNGNIIELPRSKKKILTLLGKSYDSKKHRKLNIKKHQDLITLLES